jgi:hypothetical protein
MIITELTRLALSFITILDTKKMKKIKQSQIAQA